MRGLQCDKSLYFAIFRPELEAETDPVTQRRFDEGNEVGEMAQKVFPGGVLIDADHRETLEGAKLTQAAIDNSALIIFEATFVFENFSARIDILKRETVSGPWQLIEVKSSTKPKDQHLTDIAIQTWIARQAGFKIESSHLMLINNKCVAPKLEDLFYIENVTIAIEARTDAVVAKVKALSSMVSSGTEPVRDIGPHCSAPYPCPFKVECYNHIPVPSVFDIPRIGVAGWAAYHDKKYKIEDVVTDQLNPKQVRALEVLKTAKRFVDKMPIEAELKNWTWPIYFFDFETLNLAIPIWNGVRPYQQVPFQFSCHILETLSSTPQHFEYLHTDCTDPREPIAKAIAEGFGDTGSVVAYYKTFEAGILRELARQFPKYQKKLFNIADRLVDPLPLFENHVYDKAFLNSFSLKSVAPALLGSHMAYGDLEIGDGGSASLSFLKLIKGPHAKEDRDKTIEALLRYCRQDTMATVELVKWLFLLK